MAVSAATVLTSFGVIVVKAGEDNGVREFIRQSNGFSLSGLFHTGRRPGFVAYAPHVIYQDTRSLPYFPGRLAGHRRSSIAIAGKNPRLKLAAAHKERHVAGVGLNHATAYCVRLCDGYEFPLGAAADTASQEETCQQSCPASPSALYVAPAGSDGITQARDRSGHRYTALAAAFSYRDKVSPTCTCSGIEGQGIARPRVLYDTTLKKGDIVMTARGLTVFSWLHHGADKIRRFTSIHEAASLSERERHKLQVLEAGTIARAPTPNRQAQADLPPQDFQAESPAGATPASFPAALPQNSFQRVIARTPPMLR